MRSSLRAFALKLVPMQVRLLVRVRRWMRTGHDPELVILPLMNSGGAMIDIGANVGNWAGPGSRIFRFVHAFEPDIRLSRALRFNAPKNMQVYRLALSDRMGKARFTVPLRDGQLVDTLGSLNDDANPGMTVEAFTVTTSTLDSLNLKGIDLIKIDVEGHEEATLRGASETIRRERPCMVIEIEERHHPGRSETIIAELSASGYTVFYWRNGRVERFSPGMIGTLQRLKGTAPHDKTLADSYVNNFIFIPNEKTRVMASLDNFNHAN